MTSGWTWLNSWLPTLPMAVGATSPPCDDGPVTAPEEDPEVDAVTGWRRSLTVRGLPTPPPRAPKERGADTKRSAHQEPSNGELGC